MSGVRGGREGRRRSRVGMKRMGKEDGFDEFFVLN